MNCTNPPLLFFPQRIKKMKLPGWEGNATVVEETVTDELHVGEALKLRVPVLHRRNGAEPQGWRQNPHLQTAGPKLPPVP